MPKKDLQTHDIGSVPTSAWTRSSGALVSMKSHLFIDRNGSEDPVVSHISLPTQMNSQYELKVTGVAITGKMQISIEGHQRLTITDFGTSATTFVAKEDDTRISIRCVANIKACGIITDLAVTLV